MRAWRFLTALFLVGISIGCAPQPEPEYPPAQPGSPAPALGPYSTPEGGVDGTILTGRWLGSYACAQGPSGLDLNITGLRTGQLTAIFRFYPLPSNPYQPSGSFQMRGFLRRDGAFFLGASEADWIVRPSGNWRVVRIEGRVGSSAMEIYGTIPECGTSFRLRR